MHACPARPLFRKHLVMYHFAFYRHLGAIQTLVPVGMRPKIQAGLGQRSDLIRVCNADAITRHYFPRIELRRVDKPDAHGRSLSSLILTCKSCTEVRHHQPGGASIVLISRAGLPPTTVNSGTSFVTTAPEATTAPRPIDTPFRIIALLPIQA